MEKYVVSENEVEMRLDNFLALKSNISRSKIQSLIKTNNVKVNNLFEKSNYKTRLNDEVILEYVEEPWHLEKEAMSLDIVYEDDALLVINKPNGLVVHPAPGNFNHTLANGLSYYASSLSDVNGEFRPGIVHRLDAYTTGLLVVAKNNKAHEFLADNLKEKKIKRTYIALVWGIIKEDSGTIDAPIGRDQKERKKMSVLASGKEARTHFKVLKRFNYSTLVEVELETGRTHQIRVHMNYINHPVVNDPIYGNRKLIDDSGQALHARKLELVHPITKKLMTFTAELPPKFKNILEKLEGYDGSNFDFERR